jgi:signal transduction histidine kinase
LPLAKKLTELHGGSLAIESKVNVGTRITVTFPGNRVAAMRAVA